MENETLHQNATTIKRQYVLLGDSYSDGIVPEFIESHSGFKVEIPPPSHRSYTLFALFIFAVIIVLYFSNVIGLATSLSFAFVMFPFLIRQYLLEKKTYSASPILEYSMDSSNVYALNESLKFKIEDVICLLLLVSYSSKYSHNVFEAQLVVRQKDQEEYHLLLCSILGSMDFFESPFVEFARMAEIALLSEDESAGGTKSSPT